MIGKNISEANEDFYIKENGKKVKLNLSINALPTEQIF